MKAVIAALCALGLVGMLGVPEAALAQADASAASKGGKYPTIKHEAIKHPAIKHEAIKHLAKSHAGTATGGGGAGGSASGGGDAQGGTGDIAPPKVGVKYGQSKP